MSMITLKTTDCRAGRSYTIIGVVGNKRDGRKKKRKKGHVK